MGCLSDLFLKSNGSISFDSRLRANFLTEVFGFVLVSSPTDGSRVVVESKEVLE